MKNIYLSVFCSLIFNLNAQQSFVPDTSFGNNGVFTTNLNNYNYKHFTAQLITSSGKILMVLTVEAGINKYYYLMRLNSNGTLDTDFGSNGYVTIAAFDATVDIYLYEVADGKILFCNKGIRRFNPDGSLDLSFGNSGYFLQNIYARIAIQNDGKIIASYAYSNPGQFYSSILKIERYNANGILDTTFNIANTTFNGPRDFQGATKILIQSDGKIILVYNSSSLFGNGSLSRTHRFSINGVVEPLFISEDGGYLQGGILLQYDDKLLLRKQYGTGYVEVKRYNANLSLDLGYNLSGYNCAFPSSSHGVVQSDNSVFALYSYNFVYINKIKSNGLLDNNFDSDGIQNLQLFNAHNYSMVNNSIYVYGRVNNNSNYQLHISKFNLTSNLTINQNSFEKNLYFSPNPSTDKINFTKNVKFVSIFSLDSKLIITKFENNAIDISSFSKGIYLVRIIDHDGKIFIEKLVKN